MRDNDARRADRGRAGGYTLVELLIVIAIIVLVSAATLPVVLPALEHRQVSEAARVFQASLAAARDSAIRADSPRGIRLLPDQILFPRPDANAVGNSGSNAVLARRYLQNVTNQPFAYGGILPIEPGPPYSEGALQFITAEHGFIMVREAKIELISGILLPNTPTSWYWNIRIGERLKIEGSSQPYIIRGPALIPPGPLNPEGFVNRGAPNATPVNPAGAGAEFLILTNGLDDDGDGFADEGFDGLLNYDANNYPSVYGAGIYDPANDGLDNDGDGTADFADPNNTGFPYSLIDSNGDTIPDTIAEVQAPAQTPLGSALPGPEYEPEPLHSTYDMWNGFYSPPGTPLYSTTSTPLNPVPLATYKYTIERRPVPVQGARITALPGDVVIDLTTWNFPNTASTATLATSSTAVPERSRLPVDPLTGYVDILLTPSGRVVTAGPGAVVSGRNTIPYYHFWLSERGDVFAPQPLPNLNNPTHYLPMPEGSNQTGETLFLKGERRLVTLNTRTGLLVTNPIEFFDATNPSTPFRDAQSGAREAR